jgi:hypothetical protein
MKSTWHTLRFWHLDRTTCEVDTETIPVSFARDWSSLRQSVAQWGVLTPVIVRRAGDKWQLVSGKGRWLASAAPCIPALEVSCSEREALEIYLNDNLARGFNTVECARLLHRLHHQFAVPLAELRSDYAPLLGMTEGMRPLSDHMAILELPPAILTSLASGQMTLRNALILLDFTGEEAATLTALSQHFRWSAATEREAFTLIWEIMHRDQMTLAMLLASPPFHELCAGSSERTENKHAKQAGELFWQSLKRCKNPSSARAEALFNETVAASHCPSFVTISAPPFFEKDLWRVDFQFRDAATFDKAVAYLCELAQQGNVEKLLQTVENRRK